MRLEIWQGMMVMLLIAIFLSLITGQGLNNWSVLTAAALLTIVVNVIYYK